MPVRHVAFDTRRCQLPGLAGSAALAAGCTAVGALPVGDVPAPHSGAAVLGLTAAYFGLVLLVAAWALLGVALMALCLPELARHCGADPRGAVWLGGLNPRMLLHLVSGAHNDAVMLGLLGAGLVAALGRRPVVGAVLVTLAALVKAPAALGLPAVALLWARHRPGRRPRLGAVAATGGAAAATTVVAAATTAVATAPAGTGYGWTAALDTPGVAGELVADLDPRPPHRVRAAERRQRARGIRRTGLALGGTHRHRTRRPRVLEAPPAAPAGARGRTQPGRGGRPGPRDPAVVRLVGRVPDRRRGAHGFGASQARGGSAERTPRSRGDAERVRARP